MIGESLDETSGVTVLEPLVARLVRDGHIVRTTMHLTTRSELVAEPHEFGLFLSPFEGPEMPVDANAESVAVAKADLAELDVSLAFSRKRFVSLLAPVLASIEQLVSDIMEKAELEAADIDVVIRTGGSSQIASVKRLLEKRFPGKVIEHDPFRSVAAGLAVASYYGYDYAGDTIG